MTTLIILPKVTFLVVVFFYSIILTFLINLFSQWNYNPRAGGSPRGTPKYDVYGATEESLPRYK
jgi:hypothetical protein